ncbi:WD repeat-containing protein 20, partial [Orchesella cincta]
MVRSDVVMASIGGGGDAGNSREELKSQFTTREGTYRLTSAVEFSRSSRSLSYVTNNTNPAPGTSPPVRLSFVTLVGSRPGVDVAASESRSNSPGSGPPETSSPGAMTPSGVTVISNNINNVAANNGESLMMSHNSDHHDSNPDIYSTPHRFCVNMGKELYVYPYMGCRKDVDIMSKPIDKRVYKGTNPTCHDFNSLAATQESLLLVIGFSGGQIQLVDPISKEVNKLFNEERVVDKTRVTCIRWIPNSLTQFLVSHGSGHMYLYNIDNPSGTTSPSYQVCKSGPSYTVYNCKSKTARNPVTRWTIGDGAINEFAFSPCGQFLAVVSQDGFLRIIRYDSHELVGITRSYFGGLLCVCWSPDSKYVCVGGEDDLVTLWSFKEKRVVARGQGHKSWVSVVAFDPFTTTYGDVEVSEDCAGGETTGNCSHRHLSNDCHSSSRHSRTSDSMRLSVSEPQTTRIPACYRVGSVGQDTQLCLWDLTEDVLKHPFGKSRPASRVPVSDTSPCIVHSSSKICNSHHHHQNINLSNTNMPNSNNSIVSNCTAVCNSVNHPSDHREDGEGNTSNAVINGSGTQTTTNTASSTSSSGNGTSSSHNSSSGHSHHGILSLRFAGALGFGGDKEKNKEREPGKEHKRNFSLGSSSKSDKSSGSGGKGGGSAGGAANFLASIGISVNLDDPMKLIGTQACPRLDECPLLEPLVCKKISHERLTALTFREESIVTTCQDGIVCTWARPGDAVSQL